MVISSGFLELWESHVVRILVASPGGWATEALCGLLAKLGSGCEIEVVQDAASVAAMPVTTAALVLVDVDAAAAAAHAVIQGFRRKFPSAHILALGSRLDDASVKRALSAGAIGYLPKSHSEAVTLGILRLVLSGSAYAPGVAAHGSADKYVAVQPNPGGASNASALQSAEPALNQYGLSQRQTEVLSLAAQGKTNLAIAKSLRITEGTVKLHMTAIFKALKVQNRGEAVLLASRMQSITSRQIRQAEGGAMDLDWLLPHMTHRRLPSRSIVFRKGDPGEELFYLQRGTIRLEEVVGEIGAGTMFGEIAIFSPLHTRTSTAVCTSDVDLFTLTSYQVKSLYLRNPQFALYVVHLIAKRLMADQSRGI